MKTNPGSDGFFGEFGGQFIPETLYPAIEELTNLYQSIKKDPTFKKDLAALLKDYVGRPSPLYYARRLSEALDLDIYLKREDLIHTGAHKINNTIAQGLMAKKMGKTRIIAETGAGQHGVATATVSALLGLECVIYMGAEDMKRQALNVYRIEYLGAKVVPVNAGSGTLKDATSEAMRDWLASVENTHYIIGSVVGPHPFPVMVRDFQKCIGQEARRQFYSATKRLPDAVIACTGGGSNAMGIFSAFVKDSSVQLIAVEAAGRGVSTDEHSASLTKGGVGILHGSLSKLLQTKTGQVKTAHSISAGLDYPGVGPELSYLLAEDRLTPKAVTDKDALAACKWVAQLEGIIPALETAHAFAYLKNHRKDFSKSAAVILNVSGRGDKDMGTLMEHS